MAGVLGLRRAACLDLAELGKDNASDGFLRRLHATKLFGGKRQFELQGEYTLYK